MSDPDCDTGAQERIEINLNFQILFPISEESQRGLSCLFQALEPILARFPPLYLDSIIVLPRSEMAATVNWLITGSEEGDGPYSHGLFQPDGTAVPIDNEDGSLSCYVLLSQEIIEPLTSDRFLIAETVSTVVEEFLHVWLYGQAWKRRGRVALEPSSQCDRLIFGFVGRAADEYLVLRHKTELLGCVPLIDDGAGTRITKNLLYGGRLSELVANGLTTMRTAVRRASLGLLTIDEAWSAFSNASYRGLIEPLARNAGNLDAYMEPKPANYLPTAEILPEELACIWNRMHDQLKRMFQVPGESEEALEQATRELWNLFSELGVTRVERAGQSCYLEFRAT